MQRGTNFIYAFFDEKGRPFYVGRTNNFSVRFRRHKNEAQWGNPLPKYNKLRKVLKAGVRLDRAIGVIESNISYRRIRCREQYWVQKLTRQGFKLMNLTEGGYGGFRWTREYREEFSGHRKALGLHHSLETRRKISVANKGKKFTAEHRRKLSEARRKRIITDETREKMRKSMRGKRNIKTWRVTSPRGKAYMTTRGLSLFCQQHSLTQSNMGKVANGERPNHKGWKCERI
jgi:group I intron endonuclease